MKPYVFITRKIPEQLLTELYEMAEVKMWEHEDVPVPNNILKEELERADAVFSLVSDPIGSEQLSNCPNLKVIANMAVGYDNIDVRLATSKGIVVGHTPDVLTDTTADLTFALLLATARRIPEAASYVKNDEWSQWSPYLLAGTDVHHKTIGIVGMGRIGEAVARRAKGFDMNILYHNRSRKAVAEQEIGAQYCTFEELLKQSDYVVCLAPLTPETKEIFNAKAFQQMKDSAIFINASRGGLVNESDLEEALKNGVIKGAGLDVFAKEPIRVNHPLVQLPNVVAIPHIGSATVETRDAMVKMTVQNIVRSLKGEQPIAAVNLKELGV
ncbi:2-hydroxyacid dehydrogenase [Alkalihalobacterium chitinilyticum]|uniref:D-glycerate dehydrogenase n=1 Tax=Alkalihalobacterium chitinilyticum TaxID=2980103 RepID=A0ABT5VIP3_9BACI|nr:D-glycerate dehydrogenase [Alkalihalobacterium chitinilyticum]MDE5415330.1 D-glycerate dehydrogenase [Alkalihalobacterium chitinilyticum]